MKTANKIMIQIIGIMIIFILTTINLHFYPTRYDELHNIFDYIWMVVGMIIWLSPFIVVFIVNWSVRE
jgi:hypothetical protein